jgi:roadblock/LC7 domain-containing protein
MNKGGLTYSHLPHTAGRKTTMDTHIPKIYAELKEEIMAGVKDSDNMGAMAADGWKKKAAAQGTPLINVMLNPPAGGAIFLKVGCGNTNVVTT